MTTATAHTLPHDRGRGLHDEMQRLAPRLPSLPPAAQRAVRNVIASIAEEDARSGNSAQPRLDTLLTLVSAP